MIPVKYWYCSYIHWTEHIIAKIWFTMKPVAIFELIDNIAKLILDLNITNQI